MDSKLRLLLALSTLPACGPTPAADNPRIPDGGVFRSTDGYGD